MRFVEVLKWLGYILATLTVLSVAAGFGLAVLAVAAIGGVVVCIAALVFVIAGSIKEYMES